MKYKLKLDYTEEELKELRLLSKNCNSPMNAIRTIADIGNGSDKIKDLQAKYEKLDYEDEFDFMADINNVVIGTAIFPEELYIVHDTNTNSVIYHGEVSGKLTWGRLTYYRPVIRTKQEWLDMNPAYEPMLERVED